MKNTLLFLFLLSFSFSASAQTADEIISKHLEATGIASLANVKTMRMNAKVSVESMAGMEIPLTITVLNKKAARVEVTLMGMTQISCVNDTSGWVLNPFAGQTTAEPITADEAKQMSDMLDITGHFYNYQEKGYTAEYLGTEDIDGIEAHKIKLLMGDKKMQYSYFDPASFYEIKTTTVMEVDGKEIESSQLFSNFKTIDGVVFAMTMEQDNPMAGTSVTNFTNVEFNLELADDLFTMPGK